MKKIGHTGTLDPEAVGVLPVCLGSGTKLCSLLTDWDKEYVAQLRFGIVTDTQDMTGRVLEECPEERLAALDEDRVRQAVLGFLGEYEQIPPMYSALKVDGKKLYELARAGREVEREPRRVQIREIEICGMELPRVRLRVVCSKGTYIRTLCHDIGAKLGCGGVMEALTRTRAGIFTVEEALTLGQLEELRDAGKIASVIIPPDAVFPEYAVVTAADAACRLVQNGNPLRVGHLKEQVSFEEAQQVRVYDGNGKFYGIYRYCESEKRLVPVRMFLG